MGWFELSTVLTIDVWVLQLFWILFGTRPRPDATLGGGTTMRTEEAFMRGKVSCIVIVALAAALAVQAGGTVTEETFYSEALGEDREVLVYLPEDYTPIGGEGFPVVYYLHSLIGTPESWYLTDFIPVLDDLIGDGLIDPVIVVEPDSVRTSAPPEWQAQGLTGLVQHLHVNSELLGNNEDYLVEDLVEWVDSSYNTIDDRSSRFIVARGVGGHGAIRFALRHPDVFAGASIDAGLMEFLDNRVMRSLNYMRALTPGPPYDFSPLNDGYSMDAFLLCGAFAPNMANPPWYVDFILDQDGELDPDVYQRLAAQSPPGLVADFADSGAQYSPDLFLRIGDEDEYGGMFWPVVDALEAHEVPHLLRVFEGDHDNPPLVTNQAVHLTYFFPIKATAEVSPRVADPRLYPKLLRVAVELPGDLDVADIDCSTLALIDIDGARLDCPIGCTRTCEVSDVNGNGRDDLSVWLPCDRLARSAVAMGAKVGDSIELTIRGELDDGRFFAAADTVTLGAEPNPVAVD